MTVALVSFASRTMGKNSASSLHRQLDDLSARLVHQRLRRADDQLHIAAVLRRILARGENLRLVEHPLDGPLQQHSVFQRRDLAVEPQMNAGDGRGFKLAQLLPQRLHLRRVGQQLLHSAERRRQNGVVGAHVFSADAQPHALGIGANGIHRSAQMHLAAARFDVLRPPSRRAARAAPRERPCAPLPPTSGTNRETPARHSGRTRGRDLHSAR